MTDKARSHYRFRYSSHLVVPKNAEPPQLTVIGANRSMNCADDQPDQEATPEGRTN
jgi:hypothetical protein